MNAHCVRCGKDISIDNRPWYKDLTGWELFTTTCDRSSAGYSHTFITTDSNCNSHGTWLRMPNGDLVGLCESCRLNKEIVEIS